MEHINSFKNFKSPKKFYHASCIDFSKFKDDILFFSHTKEDSLHFHKNWRNCDDNKDTILYECLIDLGKNFNPKELSNYETNAIKELITINKNSLKDGLWGASSELKDIDYPELSDFEFTMMFIRGCENWHMIEQPYFIEWLREQKYDTFFIEEYDFKNDNLGVINNDNIVILEKTLV